MAATIQSIAAAVGVSRFSVSCALNGRDDQVAAETRERILKAARELGYRPNAAAKAARTGRFHAAAFVQRAEAAALPYELFAAVEQSLGLHGMHMVAARVQGPGLGGEERVHKIQRELCVDGLLVHQRIDAAAELVNLVRRLKVPTVWLDSRQPFDAVYADERQGAYDATRQLLAAGHRRVAYVCYRMLWTVERTHFSHAERIAGYEAAMREAGLPPRVEETLYKTPLYQSSWGTHRDDRLARARAMLLADDRPTAILGAERDTAGPLTIAAATLGLCLPRDLSVVMISDEPCDDMGMAVGLSRIPLAEIGRRSVQMLMQKIEQPGEDQPAVAVPFGKPEGGVVPPPDM